MNEAAKMETLRPPLVMSEEDQIRLSSLARVAARRDPLAARLLLEEADRAEILPIDHVPAKVVTVGSPVVFHDTKTGHTRRVQVVLPGEADIAKGRISVLSLVGAGLIGLSEGQSIDWPTHDCRLRRLTVLQVGNLPEDGSRSGRDFR